MKYIIAFSIGMLAVFGIVGAIENGASMKLAWLFIPSILLVYITSELYNRKGGK